MKTLININHIRETEKYNLFPFVVEVAAWAHWRNRALGDVRGRGPQDPRRRNREHKILGGEGANPRLRPG
jgi:hypothetical protein